jgi:DNA-binding protein H-NS
MPALSDLLAQKAELEKQIESLGREQRSSAIAEIKALMADHGLTVADLSGKTPVSGKKAAAKGTKVAAKYRDPESGNAWSGRGLQPNWLKAAIEGGRKLEDFAV